MQAFDGSALEKVPGRWAGLVRGTQRSSSYFRCICGMRVSPSLGYWVRGSKKFMLGEKLTRIEGEKRLKV